jgi:hypothetical protein
MLDLLKKYWDANPEITFSRLIGLTFNEAFGFTEYFPDNDVKIIHALNRMLTGDEINKRRD